MTIPRQLFLEHWKRICRRFGRGFDEGNLADAEDYLVFLDGRLTAEEFVDAARAVWATARWFPRPADFLGVMAGHEWRTVLEVAGNWDPDAWAELTVAAKLATEAVGGTAGIREARDVPRLRAAWLDAYEREVKAECAVPRLPELPAEQVVGQLERARGSA